jgi:hypothetical protein
MPDEQVRRPYTEEEDQIIFENYYDPELRAKLPDKIDRSINSINFRFYKTILPSKGITSTEYYTMMGVEPPRPFHRRKEEPPAETQTIEEKPKEKLEDYMITLADRIANIENKISGIEESIALRMNRFSLDIANAAKKITKAPDDVEQLKNEKEVYAQYEWLKDENRRLTTSLTAMNTRLIEMEAAYNEMGFWLGKFMRLGSIDKVASLADFLPRMKATFDKFGTLVKVTGGEHETQKTPP